MDLFIWFNEFLEEHFEGDFRSERFRRFLYALKRGQEHPEAESREIMRSPTLKCSMQDLEFPSVDVKKTACQRCHERTPEVYRKCSEKAV